MTIDVALVGLDGLPPPLAEGWLAGVLGGTYTSTLTSITPPVTAPAWTCIATGLNPGKTGVIDFLNPAADRRSLEPLTSRAVRGLAFWDYASAAGYVVCVNDYPVLYPPYPVSGVMAPGFLSPRWATYPPSLFSEVEEGAGPHWEHVYFAAEKRFDDVLVFLDELIRSFMRKVKWSLYMMERRDWNLYVDVVSHTDWLFHRCWHILDENHPVLRLKRFRDEAASSEARYLIDLFASLLRSYVSAVRGSSASGVLVSDHGFGPLRYRVNTAALLEATGLMRIERRRALLSLQGLVSRLYRLLLPRRYIENPLSGAPDSFDTIDYSSSAAYTLPHDELMAAVYLSERLRRGPAREGVLARIRERVAAVDEAEGLDLVLIDTHRLYRGPRLDRLPDALILSKTSSAYFEFKPFEKRVAGRGPPSGRYTGVHRYDGVLAVWPGSGGGWSLRAHILDVAPTIMKMLGLPLPGYLDGSPAAPVKTVAGIGGRLRGRGLLRLRARYARASAMLRGGG